MEEKEQGREEHHEHHSHTAEHTPNIEHEHTHEQHAHLKEEHKHHETAHKKPHMDSLLLILVVLLGIILIINISLTFNMSKNLNKAAEEAKESSKPASIELTIIKNPKCTDCFDASALIEYIKSANVNVIRQNEVGFDSKEGKDAINKYKLTRIPAIIITGNIDKVALEGLDKKEGVLLFSNVPPPYTDAETGEVKGRVNLYYLKDKECAKCAELASLIEGIKGIGIKIAEEKIIETSSAEGKELIKKYNIGFAPALIMSNDASAYEIMKQAWKQIGSVESDGSYVLRTVYPPFINLTTGKLNGIIDIVYLTDKSCAECYDVNLHRQIITNAGGFAMRFGKEETLDISDAKGKELLGKYNITKVPTIILSGEVKIYPSSKAMTQFFSIEKDGSYIFRSLEAVGTYKDIASNSVVKAQEQSIQ